MISPRHELEDLVALARRGQLSNQETEEFERLVRADTNVADWYRWGRAFDRIDAVQPGDEALVARSVERVVAQRYPSRGVSTKASGPRRITAWLVAAVVIGTAASAMGIAGYFVGKSKAVGPATVASTTTIVSASPTRPRAKTVTVQRAAASAEPSAVRQPRDVPVVSRATATHLNVAAASPQPSPEESTTVPTAAFDLESEQATAAEMFQLANEARRQGGTALAIRRYRELQRRYPGSAEAHLCCVSLGKVLRSSGDSAAAVQEFSRYLTQPGTLEEEALVGRAEGLATLGRGADELATWRHLLARFPGSVYARRARERLAALNAQNPQ